MDGGEHPVVEAWRAAGQEDDLSLIQEFFLFVRENKKWWMLPIVLALGAMGVLVALSSTGAAPFPSLPKPWRRVGWCL